MYVPGSIGGSAQCGSGAAYAEKAAPPKTPELQQALDRLDSMAKRLHEISTIAGETVARVFGQSPAIATQGANKVSERSDSSLGLIHARLDFSADLLSEIEARVGRLAGL